VGDRCEVKIGARRGEVKYVGKVEKGLGKGFWVGILLDEPTGDSDGKIDEKEYFSAPSTKYGLFMRPTEVEVGDFPPVDDLGDDDVI
jgi:tubulin-folding cofactor B